MFVVDGTAAIHHVKYDGDDNTDDEDGEYDEDDEDSIHFFSVCYRTAHFIL